MTCGRGDSGVLRRAVDTGIRGLGLLEGFISEAEEAALLSAVDGCEWDSLAKRRVQHHGYAFDYKIRGVDPRNRIGPLPDFVEPVVKRMALVDQIGQEFDQMTVNEYLPGVGLSPHVDTHSMFTEVLASLTLAGHTVMDFRRGEENHTLLLPRRSLLILAEDARYGWRHYIPHRKTDQIDGEVVPRPPRRVSLTLRRIRPREPCECDFQEECDSKLLKRTVTTPVVEETHVKNMYDAIAPHFSSTRFSRWPKVVAFLNSLSEGAVIADAGCGNGKYLGVREDCTFLGSDNSVGLVQVCVEKGYDVIAADIMELPYRDSSCDAAICIAVLHHVSSVERRKRAISELARIMKRNGRALITVWAVEQEKPEKTLNKWERIEGSENDYFVPWHVPSHRTKQKHQLDPNSTSKSTDNDEFQVYKRFYHLFTEPELCDLVNSVAGARVLESFYDKSNWCVIFEATA